MEDIKIIKGENDRGYYIHEINTKKIKLVYLENLSTNPISLDLNALHQDVVFYYQLSGKGELEINQSECVLLKSEEQTYSTNVSNESRIHLDNQTTCCFIQLNNVFVNTYLKEVESRWNAKFPYHRHNTSPYQRHQLPITPAMLDCVEEIFQSERKGIFLELYIESLVLRLLLFQLEQMENHDCRVFCSLKKSEVGHVYAARKIITTKIDQWITIKELAKLVGTNEYTLKKGFKEVFGVPVFEFIKNYKMKEAHNMLYNTELDISTISNRLGYKNLTHFSAAFKRKFGLRPSELKSSIR